MLIVRQRDLRRRSDPRHIRLTIKLAAALPSAKYPLVPLGSLLCGAVVYGTNATPTVDAVGYPVLRPNNVTPDGLDLTDLKYLDAPEAEVERLSLRESDLLINRVNAMPQVGKAAIFSMSGVYLHTTNILRMRVDTERVLPEFVAMFLNSPAGRIQAERLARPITGVAAINPGELASILVPLPPLPVQAALLAPLQVALNARVGKRQTSRDILVGIADEVARLVEPSLEISPSFTFATTPIEMRRIGRMAPSFYNPARIATMRGILDYSVPARRLEDVATFINSRVQFEDEQDVLGLAAIEAQTGELVAGGEPAKSGKEFQKGDVLFSSLRPYLNKVAIAPTTGVCSSMIHVLRPKGDVSAEYLAVALRSPIVMRQVAYMSGGGSRPVVVETDARGILIPVPSRSVQQDLADRMMSRQVEARRLRREAEDDWERTLADFGAALFPGLS
jgi:type I restriction enzyme S subunit